jgi:hypothetical protein
VTEALNLGHGHTLRFVGWAPERDLNPQYVGIPDDPKTGAIVGHVKPDGAYCEGFVWFDTPTNRALAHAPLWAVESWEPLTISPSLLCSCGDHGFIRAGRWEVA